MNDPVWTGQAKHLTFFPTAEAHNKFYELLNADGAAESLVFYRREETSVEDSARKRAKRTRPRGRKMLAQNQFLMTSMILAAGMEMELVGAMLGGVSTTTVSRVFVTWVNFLYLWLQSEFKYPTADQIKAATPPIFLHYLGSK